MTVRRICLAVLLVSNHLTAQLLCYRLLMVFILLYVGLTRTKVAYRMELTHEFLLMLSSTLLPVYTDVVPDPHARHTMG